MGVQVPCRVHAEVPQEVAVWANQAALGHSILDRAECGAQVAQFSGPQVLGEGYFVSTIGRDEEMIRAYIRNQEMADKQLDQLQLKLPSS
jgi:hypothetical protein